MDPLYHNHEIINQHQIDRSFGVDGIIFKPETAQRVVVCFSGMNPGRYERWSWFYQQFLKDDQTVYIVFKDEDFLFFLNRKNKKIEDLHLKFMLNILDEYKLSPSKLFTIGSSMGGYAALYYSLILSAGGSLISNPLIDLEGAKHHKHSLWTRKIEECGDNWKDLIQLIKEHKKKMNLFLSYGNYLPDIIASTKIITALNDTNMFYIRHRDEEIIHRDTLDKKNMFQLINLWSKEQ
jgi:hypothetical protein